MDRLGITFAAVVVLLASAALPSLHAQDIPWEFRAPSRIVAIGDVHGAYDNFVKALRATGLVDEKLHWIGASAHLVQTGDVLDRGAESRKAIDLLMALEPQAEVAGGRVHALIGNHEFWNAVGDLRYVSRAEFEAFAGKRDDELRKGSESDAPRGVFALKEAYGPEGACAQDHRVEPVRLRADPAEELDHLRFLAHVTDPRAGERVAACGLFERVSTAGAGEDGVAIGGQRLDEGGADAGARPGDQHPPRLALIGRHGASPMAR